MNIVSQPFPRPRPVCAILAAALLAFAGACRQSPAPAASDPAGTIEAGTSRPAAPEFPAADPGLERLFAGIGGLDFPVAGAAVWTAEPSWRAFAERIGKDWREFDRTVLLPMRAWAGADLAPAREAASTLFYPFGGPDFATAEALFPGASETVLMGLEPVGNLPDLDKASPAWREAFFADLGELAAGFLERGYFITREMNDVYSRGKVDGALPVVAFFLARAGCRVTEVARLLPTAAGDWAAAPYEKMTVRPHRPYGVRIRYFRPGETAARSVYYFTCDVENKAFRIDTPLYRFFAGLGRLTTFVKSGSYLLHWGNFSTLRQFILDRSLYVLQDDTAVPYRYFVDLGWEVRLYGRYGKPVKDFTNVEQDDLRRAYEDPATGVKALPFHFGYHWRSQADGLILAKRPRRLYKSPVLR